MLRNSPASRFAVIFAVLTLGGMGALLIDPVNDNVVVPFTAFLAKLSAMLVDLVGGAATASGEQLSLVGRCSVTVANGCNGVEASLLLGAAILAFPASFKQRLIGVVAGIGLLQTINLVRIVSLLYLNCWSPAWFNFFHAYLWDALIMLDGVVTFIGWCRWQRSLRPAGP